MAETEASKYIKEEEGITNGGKNKNNQYRSITR